MEPIRPQRCRGNSDFSARSLRGSRLPGDLLVCEGGEVGRAAIWRRPARDHRLPQKALHRIRPGAALSNCFIPLHATCTDGWIRDFSVNGSTIKHLPQEDLRELPVPLPLLSEQRRIVASIEEQFSRLEAAQAWLQATSRISTLRGQLFEVNQGDWPTATLACDVAQIVSGQTPRGLELSAHGPIPFYKVGDMNAANGRAMGASRGYVDEALIDISN